MNADTAAAPVFHAEDGALYEARGLEVGYGGAPAFGPASFEVRRGEVLALLGPNGSGKTTLLKAMNGLLAPSAGSLSFLGEEASGSRRLRLDSVYLHQHPYIMAGTVSYNVSFGARARGLGRAEVESRSAEAMDLLGVAPFSRRRHRALSGGEAQRVALARALATGAEVLLLDEPTASADSASRDLIVEALRARGAGTIVFSTHDRALADSLADRTMVLERGRILSLERTTR